MNVRLFPYYLTRFVLSVSLAILVFGISWVAALFALLLCGVFILYLKSGWFVVDESRPLFPLRRDDRGVCIQHRALTLAIPVAAATYLIASFELVPWIPAASAASVAVVSAIALYLGLQWFLFVRT